MIPDDIDDAMVRFIGWAPECWTVEYYEGFPMFVIYDGYRVVDVLDSIEELDDWIATAKEVVR